MIKFGNSAGVGIDCLTYRSGSRMNVRNFTIAARVRRMGAGTTVSCGTLGQLAIEPIFTHGMAEVETIGLNVNWFLGYVPASNKFGADMEDFNNGVNHPFTFLTPRTATGQAYHIAVTYTTGDAGGSGRWSGYVDGIFDGSSGFTGLANVRTPDYATRQGAGIGISMTSNSGRNGSFNGYIWDCALWDTPLTSGEVWQLASGRQNYMPLQIRPQNLKSYFPLDDVPDFNRVPTGGSGFLSVLDRVALSGATMYGAATGYASDNISYF